eukprot:Selendium_serpulae@DN6309_c0_g1_i6.p3
MQLEIVWIDSSDLEPTTLNEKYDKVWDLMRSVDGILCPGGFGDRGIEGKAASARFCRNEMRPYFGICLGMQTAVIDFCREKLKDPDAHSAEFDRNPDTMKACIEMPEHTGELMGGSMRLGARKTYITEGSLASKLYGGTSPVYERHRHRYEVNPALVCDIESHGLKFVGRDRQDDQAQRMEIAELEEHPFFLCTQFHPEFTSRPLLPNPCFLGFILACKGKLEQRLVDDGGVLVPGRGFFIDSNKELPPWVVSP